MVFSSTIFIFFFLPITLLLYFVAYRSKKNRIRKANAVLLFASMCFYAWGGAGHFLLLMGLIGVNFLLTILMDRSEKRKKLLFVLILVVDLGNLLCFKYLNFFAENISQLLTLWGGHWSPGWGKIALPIGISFYTFQIISYVTDVYRGKVPVQKNLGKMALYVIMFPQLIAGPIVRYSDVSEEINDRSIDRTDVEEGIKRFIVGFAKKVYLANAMGNMADAVFAIQGEVNSVYAWLGMICYTLQIYYDFSAYSDMAIGLGRIFGFHFNENFLLPYTSRSIQEFWRKWHISLSSWFKDYLYIPLGGNRKGKARTYLNLWIVFFLTGFWHGAAWQFIVWGLFHGLFSVIERIGFGKILEKAPKYLQRIYTMLVVMIGWVFFRADDLPKAVMYIRNLFSFNFAGFKNREIVTRMDSLFIICLIVGLVCAMTSFKRLKRNKVWNSDIFTKIRYLLLWYISVLYLVGLSYNPFIYFQF